MSSGGKGGGSQIVGYRYYAGVHIGLCHGPIDGILDLYASERSVLGATITISGVTMTLGSDTIKWTSQTGYPQPGQQITGTGIPAGTYIGKTQTITGIVGTLTNMMLMVQMTCTLVDVNGNRVNATQTVAYPSTLNLTVLKNTIGIGVNKSVYINQPMLFGGDQREGGLVGQMDVMMGDTTQARNSYLQQYQGANCPAYRGFVSLVFREFMWTSGNPYFKPLWVEVKRILKGWNNNTVWYSAKASIGSYDMNPTHIIYQCLTDPHWGMGYSTADIDDASFTAAADTLFTEGFGLSLAWSQQSTIQDFVKSVLDHVNGTLRMDLTTGKFILKLIRGDYTLGSLVALDESNSELKSFQRAAWGDLANEVVVEHTDRMNNTKTVAVQDLAAIQSQGGVVSTTRSYPGIKNATLAAQVALRDLLLVSTPLAKVQMTVNRLLYDHEVGDVVAVYWADLGLAGVPFRIAGIDKGKHQQGQITVDLVEDVFGLPADAYTSAPPSQWTDTNEPAAPVEASRAIEVPYWEIERGMKRADIAQLLPNFAFGVVLATRGITKFPYRFTLDASADNVTYSAVVDSTFCPTALVSSAIDRTTTSIFLSDFYDLSMVVYDTDNGYAYIDDECVAVVSIDELSGEMIVRRGCLDTVPKEHLGGARVYFVPQGLGYDQTERTTGETVYYKPLPVTGQGALALADATALPITFSNRATCPYPPGNFKINGQYFPASITGPMTVSWSNRDRTQQSVSLIDFTQGNIGPEKSVAARLRLYNGNTLLREHIGGTGFAYTAAEQAADGNVTPLRLVLDSVVYEPWNLANAKTANNEQYLLTTEDATPTGAYVADTVNRVFSLGATNKKVFQYNLSTYIDISSLTYSGVSLDVSSADTTPTAMTFSKDGKTMYVVGSTSASVQPYTLLAPFDVSSVLSGGVMTGIGFSTDGTKLFGLSIGTRTVTQFRLDSPWDLNTANYVATSVSLATQEATPKGGALSADGTKFYLIGAGNIVYVYTMTSPWDITTMAYSGVSFSVAAQTTTARDVGFNSAGTKMYVAGAGSSPVYIYNLATAWDIATATFFAADSTYTIVASFPAGGEGFGEAPFSVLAQDAAPTGIAFSSDGKSMYIAGSATGKIYQYSLVIPWRVSTAAYAGISFATALEPNIADIGFSSDGLSMYIVGATGVVRQFTLALAWNIGSAVFSAKSVSTAPQDATPLAVTFDSLGLQMFILGGTNKKLTQYTMYKQGGLESLQKHDWTVSRVF